MTVKGHYTAGSATGKTTSTPSTTTTTTGGKGFNIGGRSVGAPGQSRGGAAAAFAAMNAKNGTKPQIDLTK
jgi:hypothetical protein